jgi:putative transcriptional regulator
MARARDTRNTIELTGKLLIAMPGMGDPRFDRSVIFLCAHSDDGAMGLIVNKPVPNLAFNDLLKQLGIPKANDSRSAIRVHFGGPVEHGRGFVLHSDDYDADGTSLKVGGGFGMTATLSILEEIAKGEGPGQAFLALGYSGWGPGQLEGEIGQNGWLSTEASPDIVFAADNGAKWGLALKTLGVDPLTLSAAAGRA